MYIRLKWTNYNSQPVTTRIYRTDEPVESDQLGEPIAVLTDGETEWVDHNVIRNAKYYYTFETIGENESVFSRPLEAQAVPRTGPGPQTLKFGDLNYGYYGEVPSALLFTGPELHALVGLTVGTPVATNPMWDKWARNGKTLYFPRRALYYQIPWSQLYLNGLVYGVEGPGPQNLGTPVDQMTVVQKGLDRFIVRLPTGIDDRNNPERLIPADMDNSNSQSYRYHSEVADLLYPLTLWTPAAQRSVNIQQLDEASLGLMNAANHGAYAVNQELSVDKTLVLLSKQISGQSNRGIWETIATTDVNHANTSWWPVLELIDNVEPSVME